MSPPLCLIHKWFGSQQSHGEWCQERRCCQHRHCATTIVQDSEFLRVGQRLHVTTPEITNPTGWDRGSSPATPQTVGVLIYYLLFQTYGAPCRLTVCKADSCSDMIYDMIWYDTIWYDMMRYDMIYLLTAIGLPPGGSCTVHIYTQTIHRTTQNKQYIEQHKRRRLRISLFVWEKNEFLLLCHSVKTKLCVVSYIWRCNNNWITCLPSIHTFHPFKETYYLRNAV
jgi:hypothetical protein